MSKLKLVFPTNAYKEAAKDYIKEHYENGEKQLQGVGGLANFENYEEWVERAVNLHNRVNVPEGLVSASTYFGEVEGKVVGMIDIRHELNEYLLNFGGHIGYGVRPTERRKGYAQLMLKEALIKAKEFGIEKVLITCDKENIGSAKTILSQGGVLENEIKEEKQITQRYWIQLDK